MGTNQAMLLRSHGLLTTGTSVAETIAAFVTLERVAEAHMKVPNAEPISEVSARIARDDLLGKHSQELAFQFLVQRHVGDPSVVG
jgi:ribulose-5-phosphate 4-epimerase/fuculose-1-phosphate aldolase